MPTPSLLIVGSTGRTGVQLIRAAATMVPRPAVHAFVRPHSKLKPSDASLCASIVHGDARSTSDIDNALRQTAATHIVIAIGDGANSTSRTDIREASARAVMDCVSPGAEFDDVRVAVVSSTGAGGTKIESGLGVGKLVSFMLRHVIRDHDQQERQLVGRMGKDVGSRLLVVRPTALAHSRPRGIDRVALFDKDGRAPSSHIDRADVALWLVSELCADNPRFGSFYSITTN